MRIYYVNRTSYVSLDTNHHPPPTPITVYPRRCDGVGKGATLSLYQRANGIWNIFYKGNILSFFVYIMALGTWLFHTKDFRLASVLK